MVVRKQQCFLGDFEIVSSVQLQVKLNFLLLIAVMSFLSLCLLWKREVKYSQMETDPLTLEAWWMNTSCGGFTPF